MSVINGPRIAGGAKGTRSEPYLRQLTILLETREPGAVSDGDLHLSRNGGTQDGLGHAHVQGHADFGPSERLRWLPYRKLRPPRGPVAVRPGILWPCPQEPPFPPCWLCSPWSNTARPITSARGDKTRSVFGPPSRGRTRSDGLSLQGCQVSAHIEGVEQCIRSYIEGVVGMSSFTPGASTQPLNVRQLRQGNDVGE